MRQIPTAAVREIRMLRMSRWGLETDYRASPRPDHLAGFFEKLIMSTMQSTGTKQRQFWQMGHTNDHFHLHAAALDSVPPCSTGCRSYYSLICCYCCVRRLVWLSRIAFRVLFQSAPSSRSAAAAFSSAYCSSAALLSRTAFERKNNEFS